MTRSSKRFKSSISWYGTLLGPVTLLYIAVFIIPVALVLIRSFYSDDDLSLSNYQDVLNTGYYWALLGRTFWICALASGIAVVIGYLLAYLSTRIIRSRLVGKIIMLSVLAPLFTSAVVRAFGWQIFLGQEGFLAWIFEQFASAEAAPDLLFNTPAVIIGLVHFLVPFSYLTSTALLQSLDQSLEKASRDLGASSWTTFWLITLPLSRSALIASASMGFALAVSSYVVPAVLGGGKIKLLAAVIYETFSVDINWELGSTLAVFLFVPVMVTLLLLELVERKTAVPTRGDSA